MKLSPRQVLGRVKAGGSRSSRIASGEGNFASTSLVITDQDVAIVAVTPAWPNDQEGFWYTITNASNGAVVKTGYSGNDELETMRNARVVAYRWARREKNKPKTQRPKRVTARLARNLRMGEDSIPEPEAEVQRILVRREYVKDLKGPYTNSWLRWPLTPLGELVSATLGSLPRLSSGDRKFAEGDEIPCGWCDKHVDVEEIAWGYPSSTQGTPVCIHCVLPQVHEDFENGKRYEPDLTEDEMEAMMGESWDEEDDDDQGSS